MAGVRFPPVSDVRFTQRRHERLATVPMRPNESTGAAGQSGDARCSSLSVASKPFTFRPWSAAGVSFEQANAATVRFMLALRWRRANDMRNGPEIRMTVRPTAAVLIFGLVLAAPGGVIAQSVAPDRAATVGASRCC